MPKLSLEAAREIRTSWKQGERPEQLGKRYNVSVTTIAAIVKGDMWREPPSSRGSDRTDLPESHRQKAA